ncbi:MAG: hypothetical protein Kow00121_64830 [Elainellaceae cyanobacterium]
MDFRRPNFKKLGFGAVSLLALSFAVVACGPPEEPIEPQAQISTPGEEPLFRQDPETDTSYNVADFYGQPVTIRGEIEERIAENFIRVEAQNQFEGQDILVVLPAGIELPDEGIENALIQVTGEVFEFNSTDIEQYNLDMIEGLAVYDGRAALVAESVDLEGV